MGNTGMQYFSNTIYNLKPRFKLIEVYGNWTHSFIIMIL
jgi:hypothetical protein